MFNIVLYKFSKKTGSMAQPSASVPSITYKCVARDDASLISPVVLIEDQTDDVMNYSYAYIADWGKRYYFIRDIVLVNGNHLYELDLNVDVLATYRTDIRNSSQFIMRSASNYNTDLIDTMYDMEGRKQAGTFSSIGGVFNPYSATPATAIADYFEQEFDDGYFIMGVIGNNASGVSYYQLSYAAFKEVVDALMSYIPSDMSDVSNGIAKALADPLQYVTSCFWYPSRAWPKSGLLPTYSSIRMGPYTIPLQNSVNVINKHLVQPFYSDISIPKHPQTSGRGGYMNLSPYAYYALDFQPYGTFMLDPVKMYGCAKIRCWWFVDYSTGVSILKVFSLNGSGSSQIMSGVSDKEVALLQSCTAQFGVPVQLSQLSVNGLGLAGTLVGGVASIAAAAASGGFLAPLAAGVSTAIAGAAIAGSPDLSSSGSSGSMIAFQAVDPKIYAQFAELTGPDYNRFGRPLEEIATISTLSGYTQTRNATLVYSVLMPTDTEAEMVNSLMDAGFYVE